MPFQNGIPFSNIGLSEHCRYIRENGLIPVYLWDDTETTKVNLDPGIEPDVYNSEHYCRWVVYGGNVPMPTVALVDIIGWSDFGHRNSFISLNLVHMLKINNLLPNQDWVYLGLQPNRKRPSRPITWCWFKVVDLPGCWDLRFGPDFQKAQAKAYKKVRVHPLQYIRGIRLSHAYVPTCYNV